MRRDLFGNSIKKLSKELERISKSQMRQEKKGLDKQIREAKHNTDRMRMTTLALSDRDRRVQIKVSKKQEIQMRAKTIVDNQPVLGNMKILDDESEKLLELLLSKYDGTHREGLCIKWDELAEPFLESIELHFEKLIMYSMISSWQFVLGYGCNFTLTIQGVNYFTNKIVAVEKEKHIKLGQNINIGSFNVTGSSVVFGDVISSSINIDNAIQNIENKIEELGGSDKAELKKLLDEIKEILGNIEDTRHIPRNKGLWLKVTSHMEKHSWFYGEIVGLLGSQVLKLMQG